MDIIVEVCPVPLVGQKILELNFKKNITELDSYDIGTIRLPELPNKANVSPSFEESERKDGYNDSLVM